jgi:hypothetical protein
MLNKGVPQHVISESLKVSPSTVARISLQVEIGKYGNILRVSTDGKENIFNILEKMLLMGMPPYGRRRKKKLYS